MNRQITVIDIGKLSHKEAADVVERLSGKKLPSFNWIFWSVALMQMPILVLCAVQIFQS